MKSTSSTQKSINAPAYETECAEAIAVAQMLRRARLIKYMIDNQYHATRLILEEQNEMFSNKRSANDQTDISEFFDSQIDANSEVMRYLYEVRDCLTEAIDAPADLHSIVNRLEEEACNGGNEWIFDTFSEVIQYMEQLRRSSTVEHTGGVVPTPENVLRAA